MTEQKSEMYPKQGDIDYEFAIQVHFTSEEAAHHDFRSAFDDRLEGWTVFSQPDDETFSGPLSHATVQEAVKQIDWKWPGESKVQVTPRAKQPTEWLKVGYREKNAYVLGQDHGKLRYGARRPWFFEYFLDGDKIQGRLICRQVSDDYWVSWLPEDTTPYVLSDQAIKESWVPPQGWSGLPANIKDIVPPRLRYWEHKREKNRVRVREELSALFRTTLTKIKDLPDGTKIGMCSHCGDEVCPGLPMVYESDVDEPTLLDVHHHLTPADIPEEEEFYLVHHYWKGPKAIDTRASVEHRDLFIPPNLQIVLHEDPLQKETAALTAKPYVKDFWLRGEKGPESVRPRSPGNPTPDTPAWVERIDTGKVRILEDTDLVKRYDFEGKKLKGVYILEREDAQSNIWSLTKDRRTTDLSDGEPTEIMIALAEITEGKDFLDIDGIAFSHGSWKGVYYPPSVVQDRPERMMDIPVVLGTHRTLRTVGRVIDVHRQNGDIRVKSRIEGKKNIELALEMHDAGLLEGYSLEIISHVDPDRNVALRILSYERIAIVPGPACRVCKIISVS